MRAFALVLALSALSTTALAAKAPRQRAVIHLKDFNVEGRPQVPVAIVIPRDDGIRDELATSVDTRVRESATPQLSTRIP